MTDGGADPGGKDWLVAGPPPPSPALRRRQRTLLLTLVTAVAVVVGLSVVVSQNADVDGATGPLPAPGSSRPTSSARGKLPRPNRDPVVIRQRGAIASLAGDWELFARSTDTIFRIEPGSGRITATPGTGTYTSSASAFLAGPDGVIVRPWDSVPGVAVPDGRRAHRLGGLLSEGGQIIPGPPSRLWIGSRDGNSSQLTLTDFDGHPTRTVIRAGGNFIGDGAGGVLLMDVGGVWQATSKGFRRISTGTVLAVGARHLLLASCDRGHRCSTYLYDRRTREQRRVSAARTGNLPSGTVSPDGRYAALITWNPDGGTTLSVQDLRSGRILTSIQESSGSTGNPDGTFVWSPDGTRLVGLHDGRIFVFVPATRRTATPRLDLPTLIQLTSRPGS